MQLRPETSDPTPHAATKSRVASASHEHARPHPRLRRGVRPDPFTLNGRLPTPDPRLSTRPAFTFIEVLFAIIILGVGMIMIAGMLPVAIKQNADTRNDLTAKIVAENGYAYLRTLVQSHPEAFSETADQSTINPRNNSPLEDFMRHGQNLLTSGFQLDTDDNYTIGGTSPPPPSVVPPTKAGRVVPLSFDVASQVTSADPDGIPLKDMTPAQLANYPLAWHQTILADRVLAADPRFQWLAFYRRDQGSNVIKLIIVAMRLQNGDVVGRYRAYEEDTTRLRATARTTIDKEQINNMNGPFLVPIQIEDMLTEPDRLKFVDTAANTADRAVAETGAYLIVAHSPPLNGSADDASSPGDLARPFRNNGRVFRLGARREDLDSTANNARVWELQSGFDLAPLQAGVDRVRGTADDVADGSMNATTNFDQTLRPTNVQPAVNRVSIIVPPGTPTSTVGTTAWAWLIGKGRNDPSTTANSPFVGAPQDLYVLSVDVTLP